MKSYTMYFPAMFSNICGFSAHGKRAEYKWDNFPALSSASALLICSRVMSIVSLPVCGWIE
ncbi:hypothetical protein [Bacteroides caccae]|uniref:hypothetical protein n=1 Tax=Bacteroides caccae TaxID=47678 RepID=UPI00404A2668